MPCLTGIKSLDNLFIYGNLEGNPAGLPNLKSLAGLSTLQTVTDQAVVFLSQLRWVLPFMENTVT